MSLVRKMNNRLKMFYGLDVSFNVPRYRVVWSDDETEKRMGTYTKTTEAGIYLGVETGMREIRKYWYLKPCFILERLVIIENRDQFAVVQKPYTYEPMLPFISPPPEENQLPLDWKPLHFAIQAYINRSKAPEKTDLDFLAEDALAKKKEEDYIRDSMNNGNIIDSLQTGEGVSLAGKKFEKKVELVGG